MPPRPALALVALALIACAEPPTIALVAYGESAGGNDRLRLDLSGDRVTWRAATVRAGWLTYTGGSRQRALEAELTAVWPDLPACAEPDCEGRPWLELAVEGEVRRVRLWQDRPELAALAGYASQLRSALEQCVVTDAPLVIPDCATRP